MKLSEIKFVIRSLIEKMTCPFCQKPIKESQVNILQTINNKCTLQINCTDCQKQTIVNADIQKRIISPENKTLKTSKKSAFDLESLKNFSRELKNINGNLKDLL